MQENGATDVQLLGRLGWEFYFLDEFFELHLDTLSHQASITASVCNPKQMDDEDIGHDDVIGVINELCQQSGNVTYYYDTLCDEAFGRYSFNYSNIDDLTYRVISACHALIISKEIFMRVAAGSHVDAHLDPEFIISETTRAVYRHLKEYLHINILYIPDFFSSDKSDVSGRLHRLLPPCKIVTPVLPFDAQKALTLLRDIVHTEKIDVVIGLSAGGMLAQKLRGVPKVLINPSFYFSEMLRKNIGASSCSHEKNDKSTEYEITPGIVDSFAEVERGQFRSISQKEKDITVGAFDTCDDSANDKDDYMAYYENVVYLTDGCDLDDDSLCHSIIPAIAKLYWLKHFK